jgi:hypothetical protein
LAPDLASSGSAAGPHPVSRGHVPAAGQSEVRRHGAPGGRRGPEPHEGLLLRPRQLLRAGQAPGPRRTARGRRGRRAGGGARPGGSGSPTSPAAANLAPARSTIRLSPPRWSGSATPASSPSRAGPPTIPNSPSNDSRLHSPSISRSRAELVCPDSSTREAAMLSCASTRWRVRPRPVPGSRSEAEPDAPRHDTPRAIHSDTIEDCAGGGQS